MMHQHDISERSYHHGAANNSKASLTAKLLTYKSSKKQGHTIHTHRWHSLYTMTVTKTVSNCP